LRTHRGPARSYRFVILCGADRGREIVGGIESASNEEKYFPIEGAREYRRTSDLWTNLEEGYWEGNSFSVSGKMRTLSKQNTTTTTNNRCTEREKVGWYEGEQTGDI